MIAQTYAHGRPGTFSGALFIVPPDNDESNIKRIHLPIACAFIERYASGENFGNRQYLLGNASAPLVIDEEYRCHRQGIPSPDFVPQVTAGGASPFVDICYVRYYDEITGERSHLSAGLTLASNGSRNWVLPTTIEAELLQLEGTATILLGTVTGSATANFDILRPGDRISVDGFGQQWARVRVVSSSTSMTIDDTTMTATAQKINVRPVSRVSHIELWLSQDGSLVRKVARVRLGTAAHAEATPILSAGTPELSAFTAPPRGTLGLMYNKRQIIAGVEGRRDHVFLTMIEFPERYEGLSFVTDDNEPIVGMLKYSDYVLVFCPGSTYRLSGFSNADYTFRRVSAKVGSLGHHCNSVAEDQAVVVGKKGFQLWNGSYHDGVSARAKEWTDKYRAHTTAFEMGITCVNDDDKTFQFSPYVLRWNSDGSGGDISNRNEDPTVWVANYEGIGPGDGGRLIEPEWSEDTPSTPELELESGDIFGLTTYSKYIPKSGQKRGVLYRGDHTGRVFEEGILGDENDLENHNDSKLVTSSLFFGQFGGDQGEAKKWVKSWFYVRSEYSQWRVGIFAGDDYMVALDPIPDLDLWGGGKSVDANRWGAIFKQIFPPSAALSTTDLISPIDGNAVNVRFAPVTVHPYVGDRQPEGRAFAVEFLMQNPLAARIIGFGAVIGEGTTNRFPVYAQDGE